MLNFYITHKNVYINVSIIINAFIKYYFLSNISKIILCVQ